MALSNLNRNKDSTCPVLSNRVRVYYGVFNPQRKLILLLRIIRAKAALEIGYTGLIADMVCGEWIWQNLDGSCGTHTHTIDLLSTH